MKNYYNDSLKDQTFNVRTEVKKEGFSTKRPSFILTFLMLFLWWFSLAFTGSAVIPAQAEVADDEGVLSSLSSVAEETETESIATKDTDDTDSDTGEEDTSLINDLNEVADSTTTSGIDENKIESTTTSSEGWFDDFRERIVDEYFSPNFGADCGGLCVSLTADPMIVEQGGDETTLAWVSNGALSCEGDNFSTDGDTAGTTTVTVNEETTFTVTCESDTGDEKTDSVTVTVNDDEGDRECPDGYEKIVDNMEGDLSWTADDYYDSVVLVGGPKDDYENEDPDGRNKEFSDVESGDVLEREYHDISHVCAIAFSGLTPTVEISADPEEVDEGGSTILEWDSEDADTCIGDGFDTGNATSGTTTVDNITEDTIFKITCENDEWNTSASDEVEVTVKEDDGQICPFDPKSGRTIVSFDPDDHRIRSDRPESEDKHFTGPVSVDLSAGKYEVSLTSYDDDEKDQDHEQWFVILQDNNGDEIIRSDEISDLPHGTAPRILTEKVNDDLIVTEDVSKVTAWHAWFSDYESANSVNAVCAAFDRVDEPVIPTVTIDADPTTVEEGDDTVLTWDSEDAETCYSDDFDTENATSGTTTVTVDEDTTFTVTCESETGDERSDSVTVYVETTPTPPESETFTINAHKIVCDDASDLPQWHKGNDITEDTAENFDSDNCYCELTEDWYFEWGVDGDVSAKPGDHVGEAGGEWNTFGPTNGNGLATVEIDIDEVDSADRIWVREVLKDGYLPFSDVKGNDDYEPSAEMWCYKDVVNYDNYDFIQDPKAGEEYHCVAFNVDERDEPVIPTVTIDADPTTVEEGDDTVLTWDSEDAETCYGENFDTDNKTSGTTTVTVDEDTTFTVTCESETGDESSDSVTVYVETTPTPVIPTVTIDADPRTVDEGEETLLTWDSEDAETCYSDDFDTENATSGTTTVTVDEDTTFTVTCESETGDERSDSVTVYVRDADDPYVSISADPRTVDEGDSTTLEWDSGNVDSCESSNFDNNGELSGTTVVSNLQETVEFTITCEYGDNDTISDSVTVTVNEDEPRRRSGGGGAYVHSSSVDLNITNEGISNVDDDPSVIIDWNTNIKASSQVVYGTESISDEDLDENDSTFGYQNKTDEIERDLDIHNIAVEDLEAGETYYFRPVSRARGLVAVGEELSFVPGEVSGAMFECSYLEDYLRIDFNNDPIEVLKLQVFLNEFENIDTPVSGTFDRATYNSVVKFQERYFGKVLEPWGHTSGTGYVYITTKKLINEIVCEKDIEFTAGERTEMRRFKAFMESLDRGSYKEGFAPSYTKDKTDIPQEGSNGDTEGFREDFIREGGDDEKEAGEEGDTVDYEKEEIEVGLGEAEGEDDDEEDDKSFLAGVGSAMLDFPSTLGEALRNLVMLILAISLAYLLALLFVPSSGLETAEEERSIRSKRAILFSVFILTAALISILISVESLVLPLAIVFVIALSVVFFQIKNSERPINQELDLEKN